MQNTHNAPAGRERPSHAEIRHADARIHLLYQCWREARSALNSDADVEVYCAIEEAIQAAAPKTPAGLAVQLRVATASARDREGEWTDPAWDVVEKVAESLAKLTSWVGAA